MQTRLSSLQESFINVLIGYLVALVSQLIIFPQFGIYVSISDNLLIGLYFTFISICRSYVIRRCYNEKGEI